MATIEWSAAFESTPAGNTSRKLGDDRFRELKLAIRERAQKGGHFMQDTVNPYSKDGRHAVGVGDGPDIYRADVTTKMVTYADATMTVKTGTALVVEDGIAQAQLKTNAATRGLAGNIDVVGSPAALATYNSAALVTHTLGTPKGLVFWNVTGQFEADANNDMINLVVQFDYLNTGVWTSAHSASNLFVPIRTAVNKGHVTHTYSGLDAVSTSSDGGTVPIRVQVVNGHATSNILFMRLRLTTIELRR